MSNTIQGEQNFHLKCTYVQTHKPRGMRRCVTCVLHTGARAHPSSLGGCLSLYKATEAVSCPHTYIGCRSKERVEIYPHAYT